MVGVGFTLHHHLQALATSSPNISGWQPHFTCLQSHTPIMSGTPPLTLPSHDEHKLTNPTAPTDQDSHMTSSPPAALLSPTESQSQSQTLPNMPTAASGAHLANSNGKRPHGALQNGGEEDEAVETMPNASRSNMPVQTHASSGYRWTRAEDEPGYAWTNKKALDEMGRAWDLLAHKDIAVKGKSSHVLRLSTSWTTELTMILM